MIKLPLIVGIGGINAAGRTSGHHGYKRMIHDVLSSQTMQSTWQDLAHRMRLSLTDSQLTSVVIDTIRAGTCVRRIDQYDPEKVRINQLARLIANEEHPAALLMKRGKIPELLSTLAQIERDEEKHEIALTLKQDIDILLADYVPLGVSSGGCLPNGFDLSALYHAHHHPRGLQMTVYGMSDALNSLGFEWSSVLKHIRPDQVSVYAGSALSQVDAHSMAGVVSQPLLGHRVNSKMLPLSLAEMPADFINSYIINSVGTTGHNVGACATFLYNLRLGVQDIQTGQAKVAIVGGAEAPVVPDIIEGFRVMSALATDEQLCGLDGVDKPNHRRACRPFSTNVGFTLGESAQFVVLMEEELAFELGAHVLGSIAGVYIHADGNKKSIASPGIGNYITMAKAASLTRSILGDEGLKQTYVQAHGTGTPQNRVTESHILNEIAKTYGIAKWQVSAVKSYLGHSIAVAAGDQLAAALGVWEHGYLPGIKTIDHIADDVSQSHLSILMDHAYVGEKGQKMRAALLNSKGFGGNNATAVVLSPQETRQLLNKRHSASRLKNYDEKCMKTKENILQNDQQTCDGKERIVYQFGEAVMDQKDVMLRQEALKLSQFENEILLSVENPY